MTNRTAVAVLAAALAAGTVAAQQQTPPPLPPLDPPAAPAQAAPAPTGDQPPVSFRVEVNYVEVDALVADAQGNPATGLTAGDFEILEDGKPQKITTFSLVNIPIERPERALFASQPVEPDVTSNAGTEGRLYLIVLDDLHTDFTRTPRVKAAARRFIEQSFGVNDMAAVVFTGGQSRDAQDFTNNPRLLLAAIDKFTGRKQLSETIERLQNTRTDPTTGQVGPGLDPGEMERGFRARSVMSTIRQLAEFMAGVHGRRKAMLLVSEGVDYNIFNVIDQARGNTSATSVLEDTRDAVAAATRGNVSIYSIDPRGLTTGSEDLIGVSSTFPEQGAGLQSLQNELRLSQDSLRVLSANTGGFAAVNQNDFNNAFDRIVRENSTYYLLGYYSTNERRDGRYRKLQVRVNRPGLRVVRSRDGYISARGRAPSTTPPKSAMSPAVAESLGSPLPVRALPMTVFAAPFKGTAPNAAVAISLEIDAAKLDFTQQNGTFNEKLEVVHSATDASGKLFPGDRQVITLTMKPDTFERTKARGFRVLAQANLPPGRYQLRVAAGGSQGKAGSVIYDLEVPDFYKSELAMSGVAITAASAGEVPTVKPKDPLGDFLPGPPTTAREFARGDTLVLFAEFYENLRNAQEHKFDIKTELRAEGGRVVSTAAEERSSSELQGRSGGYGYRAQLSLADLTPGLYVLHVEGTSRAGDRRSVSRDIQLRIR